MARAWNDGLLLKVINVLTYIFLFGSNTYASVAGFEGGRESYITPGGFGDEIRVWGVGYPD